MSDISRSQRKRENVMRGNPMMEGIASPRSEVEEAKATDKLILDLYSEAIRHDSIVVPSSIKEAMRERITDFASHIRQQERERAAKIADVSGTPFCDCGERIAAAIRES